MTSPVIHRVTTLDLAVRPIVWPFAEERRAEIAAHFAEKQRERPKIWNGRVLLGRDAVFSDGHLAATYFETDFASFLAWRDWGFPDKAVFNGFGMGALRASDGAFVMGEMAPHTANAGRIYFPSGTPDLDDVRDGTLDIPGSVVRELGEETGLTVADYRVEPGWHCVVTGPSIAMLQVINLDVPGDVARARIEANLARETEPELSAIHLVRGMSDLTPAMPRFVTAFVEQQLASR
ncbi:NUDIX hydrolase [Bradyrhizobium huanghuaihaiense]|uniref:NUDIX hydrolase n=1 Tax=Bradyrhizobium huanghuaihaiense TaxID=990078 RepID=UPI0021AAE1AF|nr:NUDIX hydrolase [Bradyrhizobium sp. CB3035]UWU79331.1 NUDIX hydrolase [Bradyrhizobium sp. CB3035]